MGRVRDWQDGHGQRSLVLEILDMKMIEIGLAQDRVSNGITINDICCLPCLSQVPQRVYLQFLDTELSNTSLDREASGVIIEQSLRSDDKCQF